MLEAPEIVNCASVLSLTENAVCRDESGRATGIRMMAGDGQIGGAEFELELDPSDPLEGLISDALERDLDAPYLDSARYGCAVEAIAQRGRGLSSVLTQMLAQGGVNPVKSAQAINLIGSAALFDQTWEALLLDGEKVPFSITRPVVRVVSGANPYPSSFPSDGLNVEVITARVNWSTDIPPRQITQPLRGLQVERKEFGMGFITPAFPNEIEAMIVPVAGVDDPDRDAAVLHVDAHGILLSYDQLIRRYGAERVDFVKESWGIEVAPYEGLKGFVLINGVTPNGDVTDFPISGEELGALCRRAGTPLVVLNACQAASEAAEGSIAVDLIRAGVPDVISFRHKVTASSATVFVALLYRALVDGLTAAQACCTARAALYHYGIAAVPSDSLPFPDWISLVHYSSRRVEPILAPHPVVDLDLEFSHPKLPAPLEWAVFKVQELIYRMRLSEFAPAVSGLPSRQPIVLFGPIGAGAESLLMEAAGWLAQTDMQISGVTLLDVGNGLGSALQPYFEDFDLSWPDYEIVDAIVERWGPSHAIGFVNLDLALDWDVIGIEEYQRIFLLGSMLSREIALCMTHSSRNIFKKGFAHAIDVDVLVVRCWPIATREIENWLLADPILEDDPKDRMVAFLLAWICAGHADIAAIVRGCTSAEQREILLDHFVYGTRLLSPPHEVWILQQAVQARWAVVQREIDLDPLLPIVAGVGSGITTDELPNVGLSLRGQEFPLIPRVTFDQVAALQVTLIGASLISEYIGKIPPGWERGEEFQYAVMRLNPLLRPLARSGLSSALCDELDRWAVAWATDKIGFFSNEWLDRSKRALTAVYLEHAWPLFAIAIWIARREGPGSSALLEAIDRASTVGWWPRDFDLAALFGDVTSVDASGEQSEFDRLWHRAVNLQMQGDFEEARNLLFLAIESLGEKAAGYPYYAAHYRLGTLCLDLNDLDGAAEHLAIAEGGAAHDFVLPDTLAHIHYEQGILARLKGREDRAQERFNSSIAQAQKLGLHNLLCLNFQELTDCELRYVPVVILKGNSGSEIASDLDSRIAQAEIYLRYARAAAVRVGKPTPEEGTLLLLEARILAARGRIPDAREKALAAHEAYRRWDNHQASAAANFLNLLNAATVSKRSV